MDTDSKIIATMTDGDLGLAMTASTSAKSTRVGARAILRSENQQIALVFESTYNHYKLPGGCVEKGENLEKALRREIQEKVGAKIKNIRYLGVVQSHLAAFNEDCAQHYFTAEVDGATHESAWIDEEELHGCSIVWCADIQQAIDKARASNSREYVRIFERAREIAGLQAAL